MYYKSPQTRLFGGLSQLSKFHVDELLLLTEIPVQDHRFIDVDGWINPEAGPRPDCLGPEWMNYSNVNIISTKIYMSYNILLVILTKQIRPHHRFYPYQVVCRFGYLP